MVRSILTYLCVVVSQTLMFTCFCGAADPLSGVSTAKVSAKLFQGFRRAPLPFPFQLVVFDRKVMLCDYEGDISVMDVTHIGYDAQYIYALDAKGGVFVLHLYDEYEEKYDNEKTLPENILSRIRGGTVKMSDARRMVDSFLSSSHAPKDSCFYQRNGIVKEMYGRSSAKSSFVPVDITMVVGSVTNNGPTRIVRKFQNCTFSAVSIVRFGYENLLSAGAYWREVNWKKGQFGRWTELRSLACPITIQEGGEFEICIELNARCLLANEGNNATDLANCSEIIIYDSIGGCATMRVLLQDAEASINK